MCQAVVLKEELGDLVAVNKAFNYIVQAFLGLGLIVGVAALGVISARSVVEPRHEIGVSENRAMIEVFQGAGFPVQTTLKYGEIDATFTTGGSAPAGCAAA